MTLSAYDSPVARWERLASCDDLLSSLREAIAAADPVKARGLLRTALRPTPRGRSFGSALASIVSCFDGLWGGGDEVPIINAYLAGKVFDDFFEEATALARLRGECAEDGPRAVIGSVEDDFHSIGRKAVVLTLRSAGWIVYDLGCDVPSDVFVRRAVDLKAGVVGASVGTREGLERVSAIRSEIDRRGLGGSIRLAVGGTAPRLRPDLAEGTGADGAAADAAEALALFENLACRAAGGAR